MAKTVGGTGMTIEPKRRRKKADDTTATMRRFAMLQAIPWEPRSISTADMHRHLEQAGYTVEPRTVQRDLSDYSAAFHYASESRGNAYFWFWPRHCQPLNVRAINPETAMILNMAERHLRGLLPAPALELLKPYFEQSRQTLTNQDPRRFGTWKDKVRVISRGPAFSPPKVAEGIQSAVFEALLADRQIKARYKGRNQAAAKDTVLHPLGVVSREGVIYLVATAWDYDDPYQYALHRFERAEVAPEPSKRPEGFDLDRYVETEQGFSYPTGEGSIKLKIEIDAEAAVSLLERPLSADQNARQLRNRHYRIEATVEDTSDLRWWLMGFGRHVEVVGPRKLRADIRKALTDAADQYVDAPAT